VPNRIFGLLWTFLEQLEDAYTFFRLSVKIVVLDEFVDCFLDRLCDEASVVDRNGKSELYLGLRLWCRDLGYEVMDSPTSNSVTIATCFFHVFVVRG